MSALDKVNKDYRYSAELDLAADLACGDGGTGLGEVDVDDLAQRVDGDPRALNEDPYGAAWLFTVEVESEGELLSPEGYAAAQEVQTRQQPLAHQSGDEIGRRAHGAHGVGRRRAHADAEVHRPRARHVRRRAHRPGGPPARQGPARHHGLPQGGPPERR
jgi:hypothetical protein